MKEYICFSLIVFLGMACQERDNTPKLSYKDTIASNFIVEDSIIIPYSNLVFDDMDESLMVFHNPISYDLISYNIKDKKINIFNNYDNTPNGYNILYRNISLSIDGNILVGLFTKIKKYSPKGEFLNSIEIERHNNLAPLMNIIDLKNELLFFNSPQGNTSSKNFYKLQQKILGLYKKETKSTNYFATFPLEGSVFFNQDYYYLYPATYSVLTKKREVYMMSKNEPAVYVFSLDNFELLKKIELDLKFYNPVRIEFNKQLETNELNSKIYQNSSIQNFFLHNNVFYTQYTQGYSDEYMKEFIATHEFFPNYDFPDLIYRLNITSIKDSIIYDVKIPKQYGKLLNITDKGEFIFQKRNNDDNNTTILITKLNITDA